MQGDPDAIPGGTPARPGASDAREALRTLPPRIRRYVVHLVFESRAGTSTAGTVQLSEFGLDHRHRVDYEPSGWSNLRRALRKHEVTEEDVFLDIGAGLGRVVCQAARRYRLKRIIGVEISPELVAVARHNVRRSKHRFRCPRVELVTADATTYRIPADVTVIYLFNPVTGPLFGQVVDEIARSIAREPRAVRIVYANPVEQAQLEAAGAVLVRNVRPPRFTQRWSRRNPIHVYAIAAHGTEDGLAPGGRTRLGKSEPASNSPASALPKHRGHDVST